VRIEGAKLSEGDAAARIENVTGGDAAVRIEGVTFGYGKKPPILSGFDCVFRKGKITAVVGPNGSGKSTLLGLCNRLNKPRGGRVLLDGKDVADYTGREFAKKAASVYQANEVPPEITVRALVAYGRTPHKKIFQLLDGEDEEIIEGTLKKTGLKAYENKPAAELSGGERQRVFIAMALCRRPEILFLDEPTSFLDVYYQLDILEIVRGVNRDSGATVVMALHDINQAARYADDIIVMKDGRIAAAGDAETTLTPALIRGVFGVDAEILKGKGGAAFFAVSPKGNRT
jgi:iron complex transport system ATP-binding protein